MVVTLLVINHSSLQLRLKYSIDILLSNINIVIDNIYSRSVLVRIFQRFEIECIANFKQSYGRMETMNKCPIKT